MKSLINLSIIIAVCATLPIRSEQRPTLEEYLEEQRAEDQAFIRNSICGTEIIVEKKGFYPRGYLLSCPDAKEFMNLLLQISDKSPYSISLLKMKKEENGYVEQKVIEEVSIEEAAKELALFTASINDRLAQLMEKYRQCNIKDYEKKFGPAETNQ